jgi:hypothetical protein
MKTIQINNKKYLLSLERFNIGDWISDGREIMKATPKVTEYPKGEYITIQKLYEHFCKIK